MKKIIYIVIRYSVLLENSRSWNLSRTDLQDYQNNLFNEERLRKHYELFKNITFPSILSQSKNLEKYEFKLLIITSELLPKWNIKLLENIVNPYEWVEIHYLPTKGTSLTKPIFDDLSRFNEKVLFATIRLDDDDAIAVDFLQEFENFFTVANSGYALSFGLGLCGFYDFDKSQYSKLVEYYYPKFSAGLCYINIYNNGKYENNVKTIFQAGSHSKVDNRVPTIIYSKEIMFIRSMYDFSDSHSVDRDKKLLKRQSINPNILEDRFVIEGFDKKLYLSINFDEINEVSRVDRKKYNRRFDLYTGKRIYEYTYKELNLTFYADYNPNVIDTLIGQVEVINEDFSFMDNEKVSEFNGNKIVFFNLVLDTNNLSEKNVSLDDKGDYINGLLDEFIGNIINANSLDCNRVDFLYL